MRLTSNADLSKDPNARTRAIVAEHTDTTVDDRTTMVDTANKLVPNFTYTKSADTVIKAEPWAQQTT